MKSVLEALRGYESVLAVFRPKDYFFVLLYDGDSWTAATSAATNVSWHMFWGWSSWLIHFVVLEMAIDGRGTGWSSRRHLISPLPLPPLDWRWGLDRKHREETLLGANRRRTTTHSAFPSTWSPFLSVRWTPLPWYSRSSYRGATAAVLAAVAVVLRLRSYALFGRSTCESYQVPYASISPGSSPLDWPESVRHIYCHRHWRSLVGGS